MTVIRFGRSRRRASPLVAWLLGSCLAAPVWGQSNGNGEGNHSAASRGPGSEVLRLGACTRYASTDWPRQPQERRVLLQRMELAREHCMDHAGFLAMLGGNWLEEGNAAQALLWLERALMLDPGHLGARADHALALAALGESAALSELQTEWATRTDVPPLLWDRLQRAAGVSPNVGPSPRKGLDEPGAKWALAREVSIAIGRESNLDRSPRLSELTITFPDGPVSLPLDQPLKPRPGSAASLEASWQAATALSSGAVAQIGIQGSARSAPGNADTDWQHVQLAVNGAQRWGSWRGELQASFASISGRLSDPYQLGRIGLLFANNALGCSHRVSLDAEFRRQPSNTLADSSTAGLMVNSLCSLPSLAGWAAGAAVRGALDEPRNADRAGGRQRQWSLGLRLTGPVGRLGRLEAGLRVMRSQDAKVYNPLLGIAVKRWLKPVQFTLEYSQPYSAMGMAPAEWTVQLHTVSQTSNLAVFQYNSVALFSGLRWRW